MPISQAFHLLPPSSLPLPEVCPSICPVMASPQAGDVTNHLKVQLLVRAYQARGHHKAKIDPLGIRGRG